MTEDPHVMWLDVDYPDPGYAFPGRSLLYSPTQVAAGALLGGVCGLIYFLWANFDILGNERLARRTLWLGSILFVAMAAIALNLPRNFSGLSIAIIYVVIGRYVAEKFQMSKTAIAESRNFDFRSNWRVLGYGLIALIMSIGLSFGAVLLLLKLHFWHS